MKFEGVMAVALQRAQLASISSNDIPVGALILDKDMNIISAGHNQRELLKNSIAHAEILALESAGKSLGSWRLDECTLVVTLEPCAMCAGAILQSRIQRVVFGAWDAKAGACGSKWDLLRDGRSLHKVEVISGVLKSECTQLLEDFFSLKR